MIYAYAFSNSVFLVEADTHEDALRILFDNRLVGPGVLPLPTGFEAMGTVLTVRHTSRGLEVEDPVGIEEDEGGLSPSISEATARRRFPGALETFGRSDDPRVVSIDPRRGRLLLLRGDRLCWWPDPDYSEFALEWNPTDETWQFPGEG